MEIFYLLWRGQQICMHMTCFCEFGSIAMLFWRPLLYPIPYTFTWRGLKRDTHTYTSYFVLTLNKSNSHNHKINLNTCLLICNIIYTNQITSNIFHRFQPTNSVLHGKKKYHKNPWQIEQIDFNFHKNSQFTVD